MNYQRELDIVLEAAVLAGNAIMEIYNTATDMQVEYKEGNMPLTAADREANRIIVELLKANFPEYAILSEEEQDDLSRLQNDYCFIVDPLDGTKEFLKRNGEFTVNIALAYRHNPVMGVIYVPVTQELYYAVKDGNAYLKKKEGIEKIQVSKRTENIRVVMSSSHGCAEMEELIRKHNLTNFVKMGSSLKGCVIARGDAEVYYRHNPTMEWDTAAMQCILEEAGAIFQQMNHTKMYYNREDCTNRKGFYVLNSRENMMT